MLGRSFSTRTKATIFVYIYRVSLELQNNEKLEAQVVDENENKWISTKRGSSHVKRFQRN